jgi:hypothetical protein
MQHRLLPPSSSEWQCSYPCSKPGLSQHLRSTHPRCRTHLDCCFFKGAEVLAAAFWTITPVDLLFATAASANTWTGPISSEPIACAAWPGSGRASALFANVLSARCCSVRVACIFAVNTQIDMSKCGSRRAGRSRSGSSSCNLQAEVGTRR